MWIKTTLVYLHLIAMAIAVGKMLEYDFRFLRLTHRPPTVQRIEDLFRTKATMTYALWVLWLTGLGLVYLGYTTTPNYLANEKLWMKVVTVVILTCNGILMHHFAFPHMLKKIAFLAMPLPTVLGLSLFASVSSVSWLYASFLGIARSWNHTVPFSFVLSVYLSLLVMTAVGNTVLMTGLRRNYLQRARLTPATPPAASTPLGA